MTESSTRPQCVGEFCTMCGQQAEFKVAEELQFDEPRGRHPFTAYVCRKHFERIMCLQYLELAPTTERNT